MELDRAYACVPVFRSQEDFLNREPPVGLTLDPEQDLYSDWALVPVRNVSDQAQWLDLIRPLVTEELMAKWQEQRIWEDNVLEFVGNPYFIFGARGYGAVTLDLDSAVLTVDSEDRCTVTVDSYLFENKDHPYAIYLAYEDGAWRVADYEWMVP